MEIDRIFNISCTDNGTLTFAWNVKSAIYLFVQIEYQCYYGSYDEVIKKDQLQQMMMDVNIMSC